ncbi:MAG: 50S ribosomal protein L29 [Deltaproteobacteria bacterium]|nr:50S ribosomal protein L29 [Deltaproteobacteria bacterium]
MKASEIREMSRDELMQKEKALVEELFNFKFQHAMGQLDNTMRIRQVKRELARVKTIFNELSKG